MNKKFTFSLLNYLMIVFLFVLIDQIVYFIKNKDTMADHEFITQYRHGGLIDTYHKPSKASIKIANEYLYKSKVKFQTNSDGAILPLGGKGEKRVFFIGGSTTENHWVPDTERWPYLVGESKLLSNKITTYNFGVGGYNIHQNFQKFYALLSRLEPDYVVLMNQINDIGKGLNGGYYNVIDDVPLHNSFEIKNNKISIKLKLKKLAKSIMPSTYYILYNLKQSSVSRKPGKYKKNDLEQTLSNYLNRLDLFKKFTDHLNVELIVMTQPNVSQQLLLADKKNQNTFSYLKKLIIDKGMSIDEYLFTIELFNDSLKEFSVKNNVKLIDLKYLLPNEERYFYDSIHYTLEGSAVVAKIISRELNKIIDNKNDN